MPQSTAHSPKVPAVALAGLAFLAPALGGATQIWAQSILLLALAALLILAPPRRSPGVLWIALFSAVGLLALTAFLPGHWFPVPAWRESLLAVHPVDLPNTLSPQPWLSAEAFCLLFASCVFTGYLLALDWNEKSVHAALRLYAAGIVLLAVLALGSWLLHRKVPFWPRTLNSPIDFGFFPNRNQTADVLALAGIVSTALAFDRFRYRRPQAWAWLGAVLIIGAALVVDFSRAGIVLFIVGISGWLLLAFALSSSRKGLALGIAGLASLLTLFLLFGGETLQRFRLAGPISTMDFRLAIHADAWRLAATAPWLGQGLGNFEPVFALARNLSAGPNRALHPESDWLWSAVELGWPATVLLLVATLLWLKNCVPFESGSERFLRSAATLCGAAFALHGLVDVSGHRLGAVWPALFLGSLAMRSRPEVDPARWVALASRGLGVILAGIGLWWLASSVSERVSRVAPTSETLARLMSRLEQQTAENHFPEALQTADQALAIAPLDWRIYHQRGIARLATSPVPWPAQRDFDTARYLEPRWVASCFNEGKLWMAVDQPDLAMAAWTEALHRAGSDAPGLYSQMLGLTSSRFTMHTALQDLALSDHRELLLVFLHYADRLECEISIGRLLDADPTLASLTHAERRSVFAAWFERGDRALLVERLRESPDWQADGWFLLAQDYAERQDFKEAYRLARQLGATPALPFVNVSKSLSALEEQFRFHPDNFQEGLELYFAQCEAGQPGPAVNTLAVLQTISGHPAYVSFLEAEARAGLEDWEHAWNAWRRYAGDRFQ